MRASVLLAAFVASAAYAAPSDGCRVCHAGVASSFSGTAHSRASRPASSDAILGSFADRMNVLLTRREGVYFRMEQRADGYYQTGLENGKQRSARFDVVLGSGRRGQSYLSWRNGLLYQLPVSWHVSTARWINSPGYEDGTVHFDRLIPPQCLGCHGAPLKVLWTAAGIKYDAILEYGIGCLQCHGPETDHEKWKGPSRWTREEKIEVCARCHGGAAAGGEPAPDVHGNQVGLMRQSKCFQSSGTMTCSTCHDVHTTERSPTVLAAKCVQCHTPVQCKAGQAAPDGCVTCHMPLEKSKKIVFQTYRTHRIAVYKGAKR